MKWVFKGFLKYHLFPCVTRRLVSLWFISLFKGMEFLLVCNDQKCMRWCQRLSLVQIPFDCCVSASLLSINIACLPQQKQVFFFFFFSPCFGSDRRRKHKHSRHKQKFHLFPFCVEKETGLTGGEARTRDGANENLGNGGDTGNTLWVMWLARRALLCFAGRPCIKPAVIFFNTRLLRLTATVTGKQLDRRGGKRTPMNEVVSMAYLMEGDSCSSTSPLTTN